MKPMFGISLRGNFPLSDDELIARSLLAVKQYERRIRGVRPFNIDECVSEVVEEFKKVYKDARGYRRRNDALKAADAAELSEIYERVKDRLNEGAKSAAMTKATSLKAKQISKVSAEAAVKASMAELGYQPSIVCQCYRIKVYVTLPQKYVVSFAVSYKDIMNGKLDECIKDFQRMVDTLNSSKCTFSVGRR